MLLNIAILEDDPKQSKELYKLLTTWAADGVKFFL